MPGGRQQPPHVPARLRWVSGRWNPPSSPGTGVGPQLGHGPGDTARATGGRGLLPALTPPSPEQGEGGGVYGGQGLSDHPCPTREDQGPPGCAAEPTVQSRRNPQPARGQEGSGLSLHPTRPLLCQRLFPVVRTFHGLSLAARPRFPPSEQRSGDAAGRFAAMPLPHQTTRFAAAGSARRLGHDQRCQEHRWLSAGSDTRERRALVSRHG